MKTKDSIANRPADDAMNPSPSGSDVKSDNHRNTISNQLTSAVGSELSQCENVFVPNMNTDEESIHKTKSHITRFADNVSNRRVGYGSPISPNDEGSPKLPDVKCKHMFAMQVSASNKKHNINANFTNDPDKYMICELTEATAQFTSVEANRLLLEIVYPHEFYDRFQRSGKRTKYDVSQCTQDLDRDNSEPINTCKTVKMTPKWWRREKSLITGFQPGKNDSSDPSIALRDIVRNIHRQHSDIILNAETRFKRESDVELKKEIHLQCKARDNALVVTDDSKGQSMVLRGLKGWIMKKDDTCKNKVHKEIRQCKYDQNIVTPNNIRNTVSYILMLIVEAVIAQCRAFASNAKGQ